MIKNREKIYKTVGVSFIVLFIIVGFASRFLAERSEPQTIPLSTPSINRIPGLSFPIESSISVEQFISQKSLPVYLLDSDTIDESSVTEIAQKLGFEATARNTFYDRKSGEVYVWVKDDATLRIVSSLGLIEYKAFIDEEVTEDSTPQGVFIEESAATATAGRFLQENGFIRSQYKIGDPKVEYIVLEHEGKKTVPQETAQLMNISFPLLIDDIAIVNDTAALGSINILMDKQGEIVSAYVNNVPEARKQGDYALKSFDAFDNSLGQAEIQMLDDGRIPIYQIPNGLITKVVVTEVGLKYYEEQQSISNILQPIFELKGQASLSDGQQVPVLLYLPALAL